MVDGEKYEHECDMTNSAINMYTTKMENQTEPRQAECASVYGRIAWENQQMSNWNEPQFTQNDQFMHILLLKE